MNHKFTRMRDSVSLPERARGKAERPPIDNICNYMESQNDIPCASHFGNTLASFADLADSTQSQMRFLKLIRTTINNFKSGAADCETTRESVD